MGRTAHAPLISVDGLRPDALPLVSAPILDRLIAEGTRTRTCRADIPSLKCSKHSMCACTFGGSRTCPSPELSAAGPVAGWATAHT